jgi:polyhydroxybutyrate depolymerase
MKHLAVLSLSALLLWVGCKKEPDSTPISYGKNRFTLQIDGVEREYYVHVPALYTGTTAVPMVFMLHGTSGDGEKFYNTSGWKEVGETENILTVFPSSGRHCIFDEDGIQKNTTKWNSQPSYWTYCAGETPLDDIKFLESIITEMSAKYKVDSKRIYLVGFSNGGQMAAKCAVQMSQHLAAVVESAGSFSFDTTFIPQRNLPVTYQVGNEDYGPGNTGPTLPLSMFNEIIQAPNLKFKKIASTHVNTFDLSPTYNISGDTNVAAIATYLPLSGNTQKPFNMVLIKGLGHAYPNGSNHPLKSAELNWQWMKQFQLE